AIRRKYKIIAGFAVVLVIFVILAFTAIKFILFPSVGINFFLIRAEAPIGTPLEKTHELIRPVEKLVRELPDRELDTYVTTVGKTEQERYDPYAGQANNLAQIAVYLTPEQDRKRDVSQIIAELREKTGGIKGFTELRFDKPQAGPPVGKAVEAKIRGEDFSMLDKIAAEFMGYLSKINGTSDVTWDHKPGKEEIRISVDRKKATRAGLSTGQIAKTIRAVFEGGIATQIKPVKAEEETDVTVRFDKADIKDLSVFEDILVLNRF
ncbi:unnamed protein product, partial [marine sediment metagenome]